MTASFLGSLLKKSLRGDERAFLKLVEATRERLFWTARRMVGRDSVAEEILQDAYLGLWSQPAGKLPDDPMAWLRRFCINRAIDHLRREETKRSVDAPSAIDFAPAGTNVERGYRYQEAEEKLFQALDRLPPQERAVFILKFIEDVDYADIAEALGVAPSTARNQAMQARRKVESELKAKGIEL